MPYPGIEYAEDSYTWKVNDIEALGVAVKSLDKYCNGTALFRGQRDVSWLLHSKYRRSMATTHVPPASSCATEMQDEWNAWHFELVRDYLTRFGDLSTRCPHFAALCRDYGADPHFELHKAVQQYADVISEKNFTVGSNFVDFSSDYRVGLFFSAHDPDCTEVDKPGALIVINPTILNHIEESLTRRDEESQILQEFREDLGDRIPKADFPFYRVRSTIPCARTRAQKARYLAQMDFRHCATLLWQIASEKMLQQHFCKIEYPAELKPGVLSFCSGHGIDHNSMYPRDHSWEANIKKIGIEL